MSVPSYPFHSLPLKLSNKEMNFPFLPLKLPNKGMEEYSKMIFFYFFPFPPLKRGLRGFFFWIDLEVNSILHQNIYQFISQSKFQTKRTKKWNFKKKKNHYSVRPWNIRYLNLFDVFLEDYRKLERHICTEFL